MFATLHDELRPYLIGNVLRHPLVTWEYAYPALFGRLNRLYDHLLAIDAGQNIPNEWDQFHPELNPAARWQRYWDENVTDDMKPDEWLTPERLRFIGHYWNAPEILVHSSSFWEMVSGETANIAGAMNQAEMVLWEMLPNSVLIYRAHPDGLLWGCCWYPERTTALAWSLSVPRTELLSSATIFKEHIRAVFTRTGETEFIVNCRHLRNIVTIDGGSANI